MANVGKRWSRMDDFDLLDQLEKNRSIEDAADFLCRTVEECEARRAKLQAQALATALQALANAQRVLERYLMPTGRRSDRDPRRVVERLIGILDRRDLWAAQRALQPKRSARRIATLALANRTPPKR
jgi:uncharacterized heparinase superfamily protein